MRQEFAKPPKTYCELITTLSTRGLIINDFTSAEETLSRINYYRLRGYYIHLYDSTLERFSEATTFEQIIAIHDFDLSLGHLTAEYLMGIEIGMRTQIAYFHSHKYGGLGYIDSTNFLDLKYHNDLLIEIKDAISKSKDSYISHFSTNYNRQYPLWAVVEILSMGTLSKFYSNMLPADSRQIAKNYYGILSENPVITDFKGLGILRNICAHGGRIYNRPFPLQFAIRSTDKFAFQKPCYNTYFAALLAMKYLTPQKACWIDFVDKLENLIQKYGDHIDISKLGLQPDWKVFLS